MPLPVTPIALPPGPLVTYRAYRTVDSVSPVYAIIVEHVASGKRFQVQRTGSAAPTPGLEYKLCDKTDTVVSRVD